MIDACVGGDGEALLDGAAIFARVNGIDPVLSTHAGSEAERARGVSKPAVAALRWAEVFQMAMPGVWRGLEVDIRTQVEITERVVLADAFAAWCTMIDSESGCFPGCSEATAARHVDTDLDLVATGFPVPARSLEICDGRNRLSGRWSFGSGITHADVTIGGAIATTVRR